MHKLITFRKLQELCESKYWWNFEPRLSCQHDDIYEDNTTIDCCSKNCPVMAAFQNTVELLKSQIIVED